MGAKASGGRGAKASSVLCCGKIKESGFDYQKGINRKIAITFIGKEDLYERT